MLLFFLPSNDSDVMHIPHKKKIKVTVVKRQKTCTILTVQGSDKKEIIYCTDS